MQAADAHPAGAPAAPAGFVSPPIPIPAPRARGPHHAGVERVLGVEQEIKWGSPPREFARRGAKSAPDRTLY